MSAVKGRRTPSGRRALWAGGIGVPVLAALTVGIVHGLPGSDAPAPRAAPASRPVARSVAPSVPEAPTASGAVRPVWQGAVVLGFRGVDFLAVPPREGGVDNFEVDVTSLSGTSLDASTYTDSGVARWTRPGSPGPVECAALLAAHGVRHAALGTGDRFCIGARGERMVFVTVGARRADARWDLTATVWRPPHE